MDWKTYEIKAMRTQADQSLILERLYHEKGPKMMQLIIGVIGLSDEVGELNNAVKKSAEYNKPLDTINVAEEVGDCLWRLAQICAAVGISLEECAESNINKLAIRYPEKFTDHLAAEENRDREAERKTLETPKVINKGMDEHAAYHGLAHWKCIDTNGNEFWERIDGLKCTATFQGPNGYPDDLRKADEENPMTCKCAEVPPLDLTLPRITEPANYQPHGYDGICKTCKKQVHHSNKTGYCANCYNRAKEAGLC